MPILSKSLFSIILTTFLLATFFGISSRAEEREPIEYWRKQHFWTGKPELMKQISDRKVITSAKKEDSQWWMKVTGQVQAPRDFVFKRSQDYNRLNDLKDVFQKVDYDPQNNQLRIEQKFLGRVMISYFFIEPVEIGSDRYLYFKMLNGPFEGSVGVIDFSDVASQNEGGFTQVSTVSRVKGELKWIPDMVFGMAVEAVMHVVANSMRNISEEEWKKTKK